VDIPSRTASLLPTLGVWQNSININTVTSAAPNGARSMTSMRVPQGSVM